MQFDKRDTIIHGTKKLDNSRQQHETHDELLSAYIVIKCHYIISFIIHTREDIHYSMNVFSLFYILLFYTLQSLFFCCDKLVSVKTSHLSLIRVLKAQQRGCFVHKIVVLSWSVAVEKKIKFINLQRISEKLFYNGCQWR